MSTMPMVASEARALQLFWKTPLIYSKPLSALCSRPVYLKLDCLQASGSFKDRGMAHLIVQLVQQRGIRRVVSSSGGNAGLAAASIAQRLSIPCTVVVPKTTKALVIEKLTTVYNATVQVVGDNWNQADAFVREQIVAADTMGQTAYVPPYDHEWLWTGHSTVVDEIYEQLEAEEAMAAAAAAAAGTEINQQRETDKQDEAKDSSVTIILSVGGGGLLAGVLEGLERRQNQSSGMSLDSAVAAGTAEAAAPTGSRVIAAETTGASCFGQAWSKGEVVTLSSIDSIATSLGALSVTPAILKRAQDYHHSNGASGSSVASAICTDAEAVDACLQLARDHRLLVEPACGAALAVLYSDRLRREMGLDGATEESVSASSNTSKSTKGGPIVIQVCGGSGVSIDLLQQWQKDLL